MGKSIRITLGALCVAVGVIFFILPGSILFLIAGLVLLSFDVPLARRYLSLAQKSMSQGARKLDKFILNRKLSKR